MALTTQAIIILIVLIAALVCFLIGAYGGYTARPDGGGVGWARGHWIALGLALLTIAQLIAVF